MAPHRPSPPILVRPGVQDTDDIDFLLSMSMSEFGNCIMQLLATIIFIAVVQVGCGCIRASAWG